MESVRARPVSPVQDDHRPPQAQPVLQQQEPLAQVSQLQQVAQQVSREPSWSLMEPTLRD